MSTVSCHLPDIRFIVVYGHLRTQDFYIIQTYKMAIDERKETDSEYKLSKANILIALFELKLYQ